MKKSVRKASSKGSRKARVVQGRMTDVRPRSTRTPLWAIVTAVLLFAILIGGIAYELTRGSAPASAGPQADGDRVLVTVNGEPITQSRLDFHYNLLPESYRSLYTEAQVLDEIVSEELLVQAATDEGFSATQEEVHARVQDILARNELTIADLEENLAAFNVTTDDFEWLIARQLVLDRYRKERLDVPEPTEAEIAARYAADTASYAVPEQVVARHVLIRSERDDAAILAKGVYDAVVAGADICDYASNTSDDLPSKDTCGEYTFPRGRMVPEFEDAAFGMEDGETRLIQTQFGYHVLQRVALEPAGILSLAQVHDQIADSLRSEASASAYRALIEQLRARAVIVYAGEFAPVPAVDAAPTQEPIAPSEPEAPAAPEPTGAVIAPAPVEPETPVAPAAPEPIAPTEPVAPAQPSPDADGVFACIASRAVLYGTAWSSDTYEARKLFADAGVPLRYVSCEQGACDGVVAYPTWEIADVRYVGRMTLEQLRRAADC